MFYSSKNHEKMYHSFQNIKQQTCFYISEGSCDTEVMILKIQLWHHMNKLHFEIYSNKILNCNTISQYYKFYCIFYF